MAIRGVSGKAVCYAAMVGGKPYRRALAHDFVVAQAIGVRDGAVDWSRLATRCSGAQACRFAATHSRRAELSDVGVPAIDDASKDICDSDEMEPLTTLVELEIVGGRRLCRDHF